MADVPQRGPIQHELVCGIEHGAGAAGGRGVQGREAWLVVVVVVVVVVAKVISESALRRRCVVVRRVDLDE